MKNSEKAKKYFEGNCNCSQAVFAAYADRFGIKEKDAIRIAAGFGGGIGRLQGICGAISGGVMVIGCRYFDESNTAETKDTVYNKVKELNEKFKEKHKHSDCYNLTGVDFNKEGWIDEYNIKKVRENKCNGYIRDVCEILEKLI